MKRYRQLGYAFILGIGITGAAAAHSWLDKVSESDRNRVNPYANQNEAVAAGAKLYADHCEKCHGSGALGTKGKPSLRSRETQQATDGELFWLLKNGNRYHGMPSWSSLPEPARWQIITFIKSLGESDARGARAPKEAK